MFDSFPVFEFFANSEISARNTIEHFKAFKVYVDLWCSISISFQPPIRGCSRTRTWCTTRASGRIWTSRFVVCSLYPVSKKISLSVTTCVVISIFIAAALSFFRWGRVLSVETWVCLVVTKLNYRSRAKYQSINEQMQFVLTSWRDYVCIVKRERAFLEHVYPAVKVR